MNNKIKDWKQFKSIIFENETLENITLHPIDDTGAMNDHRDLEWNGNKNTLTKYVNAMKKQGATEIVIVSESNPDYFLPVWNQIEGYIF